MDAPPSREPSGEAPAPRPELSILEASSARERACAECGRRTEEWRPVRRQGLAVILCAECASRPTPGEGCPACASPLRPADRFCGSCGARIEYACPSCDASVDADDPFCGACGARLG